MCQRKSFIRLPSDKKQNVNFSGGRCMIFPDYIKKGDIIGVTAPSSGVVDELKIKRFQNGVSNLKKEGYEVVFTDNVFTADKRGCSSSGQTRAKEFGNLIKDDNVRAVVSAGGGDYLMEMLDYIDYEQVKANPKWIQGYSDNTGLIYPITTKCDIATIYGFNFSDFGMGEWERSVTDGLKILEGTKLTQESFEYHEDSWHDSVTGLEGYARDKKVKWKNYNGVKSVEVSGRLLGGCLDVITFLAGTKYDGTLEFAEKYKEDGILWYLESFDMNDVVLITSLWQLKQLGYFKYASGFVFGRPLMYNTWIEQSYEEAVMSILGDLDVPIIFDADIGHKGPQFSMINGAKAVVKSEGGKGVITYVRA